ncbi:MAG: type I DNA topoisomerase [Bacteroidetes bacterium]|nr:type I DNA topoisomerase [Bacteroidota bacterium]
MAENLVIVESPAKAKTIEGFLGKDFIVKSSYGHVRDLAKGDKAVDIKNQFKPTYEISEDKERVIAELRKLCKTTKHVWLATDEDREGEAISWHLAEVLGLDIPTTRRIVFHEITKKAINEAIQKPRNIDMDLVNAQQARRILDRLVGFELSPVLWKKVKPSLSAGRVQSVAVRLIVERERDVESHNSTSAFKVVGYFTVPDGKGNSTILKSELSDKFPTEVEAQNFLEKCKGATYTITDIETKPGKKTPSAPFTTSTLQQEASRKLGFSVAQTMLVAQRLYEAGKITYMRTDSVNLSEFALDAARNTITQSYGSNYHYKRVYKNKSANAQEAHEAIRPSYFENSTVEGENNERRLYELIWKRSIASQMADAILEKTIITIAISTATERYITTGEVIKFDGFLKVYMESTDEETEDDDVKGLLPPVNKGQVIDFKNAIATQKFTYPPARFTEASLVKRLEELGIGRPSTYAPTISTVQKRGYVIKEDRQGRERSYTMMILQHDKITSEVKTEITGAERSKLFPTDIGTVVTDFLVKNFDDVLDYSFTARVEEEFDEISRGEKQWEHMLNEFYEPFHKDVLITEKESERANGERILGTDPVSGKIVSARIGRFGPLVQLSTGPDDEKPQYAKLRVGQRLETITMEEALELFKLPRVAGMFEDKDMTIGIGRFGPYIRHDSAFYSLGKTDDPYEVDEPRCIEIITNKRQADIDKVIRTYTENQYVRVLKGRWGPFISYGKLNLKIPKGTEPASLTYEDIVQIANGAPEPTAPVAKKAATRRVAKKASANSGTPSKKAAAKKAPSKKTSAKKKTE